MIQCRCDTCVVVFIRQTPSHGCDFVTDAESVGGEERNGE